VRDEEFGRRQNTELDWNDPFLWPTPWPNDPWGRSSPVFCPRMSLQTIARSQEKGAPE